MKPIILWSVPRSASTVFERVFIERGDSTVFHEPFSEAYYFSTERRSNRYSNVSPKEHQTYNDIVSRIFSPHKTELVFVKEMAFHLSGYWSPDLLDRFNNTFLIREPISALNSQYKILPDFTLEESGYPLLHDIFFALADKHGQPPIIIDTEELTEYPINTIREYCTLVGIPFIKSALTWEKRDIPEWGIWDKWHIEAANSTKIHSLDDRNNEPLSDHVKKIADMVVPIYEKMKKYSISINNDV